MMVPSPFTTSTPSPKLATTAPKKSPSIPAPNALHSRVRGGPPSPKGLAPRTMLLAPPSGNQSVREAALQGVSAGRRGLNPELESKGKIQVRLALADVHDPWVARDGIGAEGLTVVVHDAAV